MATTYDEIIGFLSEEGLKFHDLREDGKEGLMLAFRKGEDDDKPENVVILLDENGEFIHLFEPMRYRYLDGEHKTAVLETLLAIQWESKMLQWEYDRNDGEIRACIEMPLEDARLTKRMFLRALHGLVSMMDHYHPRIRKVMETGEDPGPGESLSEIAHMLERMLQEARKREGSGEGEGVPDAI